MILFDGGMNTAWRAVRRVALPAGILATFGVALTAGLMAGDHVYVFFRPADRRYIELLFGRPEAN